MKILSVPVRYAFTLLELMIAISMGMLLVYAAMAGFRITSQTVTSANRLALENSLLRAGFSEALHELDFWTAYDNPQSKDSTDQALRNPNLPFSQLPTASNRTTMAIQGAYVYSERENDKNWDATYPWPVSSSRTWWRANTAEFDQSIGRFGDYSIFASTSQSGFTANHTWLFDQMKMLHENLGYYAFCDYLPPSMLYTYIGKVGTKFDLIPEFTKNSSSTGPNNFRSSDGGSSFAQGRYRCTKNTTFFLVPLKPLGGAGKINKDNFRLRIVTGIGSHTGTVDEFMNTSLSSKPQLEAKPNHWPNVELQVTRFFNHNRFVCLNKIQLVNNVTGQLTELSFSALGTTMRGARQQRKPGNAGSGAGWAAWHGPNDTNNDKHLDFKP